MKKVSKKLAVSALALALFGSGSAYAAYNGVAGPQANGTGVTTHGWTVTPAGKQVTLGDFPMGGAISPDHKYLVVSNDGEGTQSLQVVDIAEQKVIQTIPYTGKESLYLGVAFSPDGKTLYASGGGNNKIRVYSFDNGSLTEQTPIVMKDQNNTKFYPAGISVSSDGKYLFTANNGSNSVSLIDLATQQMTKTVAVGKDPYTVFLNKKGSKLYVSNWGESSVTVLNAKDLSVEKVIQAGLHPNAITENPVTGLIYVADGDSDQITVIDPNEDKAVQTISLAPYKGALPGSSPDALTISSDGKTLYVANAGNNDIAAVDLGNGKGKGNVPKVTGLIPTAWYPTGVYLDETNKNLILLNGKGLGAGPNTQNQYIGSMISGTMSFIPIPKESQLKKYSRQVKLNNEMDMNEKSGWLDQLSGKKDFPIPRFENQSSPIKHVIYILKENRTYDQVFGDIKRGNGDPSLTMFGEKITPNLHKLTSQFELLDNFYADGEVSEDGHQWTDAGLANDYIQKAWPTQYAGRNFSYDYADAASTKHGYLWDNIVNAGLSFRDYGEAKRMLPSDPIAANYSDPNYPTSLKTSDVSRFDEWNKEFGEFVKNDNLPQSEMIWLPSDHTGGTQTGFPTPQAMVAQNDQAVGKIVDAVSHSKYWKDTAIFVEEDDAQNGPDHVDAHRTEALVISPYTQTGKVDRTFYDQDSMLRTMELILGIKPMTQFDASAVPMLNVFTNHPNFTTYQVEAPQYPLDQMNGKNAPEAKVSNKMNFSKPDAVDYAKLNRILWEATKGKQPYPVDKKAVKHSK